MSDDGEDDSGGGGGGDSGGFFSWFWNAVLSLFGGGDEGDDSSTDTTKTDASQQGGTPGSGQPTTTPGEPLESDDTETVEAAAPVNVTTTEAPSGDEDPNPVLPPGHEIGRWYQNIDGKWVRTDFTDVRDLGIGDFAMEDEDGVTHIHFSGGPDTGGQDAGQPSKPPDDPKMTGYVNVRPQGPQDVQDIPGGSPDPNTWVYTYASVADLPDFLQQPESWDGDTWIVPSTDGGPMYVVFLQPDGTVIVWRTGH